MRIGRISCVFLEGAGYPKAGLHGLCQPAGRGERVLGRFGVDLLTLGFDGGRQKTYDVAVFRAERENRSGGQARVLLPGEPRRVGCVRWFCLRDAYERSYCFRSSAPVS